MEIGRHWSKMGHVREIVFDSFEPVYCSSMIDGLWDDDTEVE